MPKEKKQSRLALAFTVIAVGLVIIAVSVLLATLAVVSEDKRLLAPLMVIIGGALIAAEALVFGLYSAVVAERNHQASTDELATTNASALVLESTTEGIVGIDENNNCSFINNAAARMIGYSKEELIGKKMHGITHHSRADGKPFPVEECPIRKAYKEGKSIQVPFDTFWRKDGTSFSVSYSASPMLKEGRLIGAVVTVEDISGRKKIDEALRTQDSRFRKLIEGAHDVVHTVGRDGIVKYASPSVRKILGYAPEEFIGTHVMSYVHPDDLPMITQSVNRLNESNVATTHELRVRHKDGEWIDIESVGVNMFNDPDVGALVFHSRDITERKRSEAVLQETQRMFTAAQQVAHIGSWYSDPGDAGKLIWSDETCRIFGITRDTFDGKVESFFKMIHPDDVAAVRAASAAALAGKAPYDIEHRVVRPDGSVRWVHERGEVRFGKDGKPLQMIGTAQDMTEHHEDTTRIKELGALRNKFIQIVSHQFRSPLNAVRWNLEALLANELGPLKPEQREFLRITHDANGEVIERIRDLLTALDIEENRIMLTKEDASLESLWGGVMADWKKRCGIKDITCEYVPPSTALPTVAADTEKIRDVFKKLTDNALDYTAPKGKITAGFTVAGGRLRFTVTDTGIGIPAAEQPRLWQRFFRATNAPSMRPDASGLGLFITKHLVERHGGTTGFTSDERKGSSFWFELPVKRSS